MYDFELENLTKSRHQTQQKLLALDRLVQKVSQMSEKMTHKGYEKINSVMMRKVQVKHTSEFIIKLNDEYFAQVKTHTVVQNLQRKKKNYQQILKKVNHKIELIEKKKKKVANHQTQNEFLSKYHKSTVQSIGKNQQGQQIFNIIEVEGQEDTDISQWANKEQKQSVRISPKKQEEPMISHQTKAKQSDNSSNTGNKSNQIVNKSQSSGQSQDDGGDLLVDQANYSSDDSSDESSLDQIQQQQSDDQTNEQSKKLIPNIKSSIQQQGQSQQHQLLKSEAKKASKKQLTRKGQDKSQKKRSQISKLNEKPQTARQAKNQQKITEPSKVEPVKQQPKPISRFKLQRMKQKLQQSI